jgi:hypothetical protein
LRLAYTRSVSKSRDLAACVHPERLKEPLAVQQRAIDPPHLIHRGSPLRSSASASLMALGHRLNGEIDRIEEQVDFILGDG